MHMKLALLQTHRNNKPVTPSSARAVPAEPKRRGLSCG